MFSHGGADDKGFDVECQKEAICKAVGEIFVQLPAYGNVAEPADQAPAGEKRGQATD